MSFNPDIHEKIIVQIPNTETGELEPVEKGYRIKPQPVEPERIRVISVGSFRRRFTLQEKIAIEASAEPAVKVLDKDLMASSYADLDFQQLIDGLTYLESQGILAAGRTAELLVDGQEHERPGK